MYSAQTTKDRIKSLCKEQKRNIEDLISECELGTNAIRQISDTKGMASVSLGKIADVLNCSVDYLLGRTENPKAHLVSQSESGSALIPLITILTPEQQELVAAYVKGILANQQKK